jgi:hypothetical protein
MVDRTLYRQQKTVQHQNTMTRKEGGNNGSVQPTFISPSFLVIVFWCCTVICCLYGVLSTIIFPFFPGHRVLVLQSFVVYMVFCPPLFSPFFPGHRVLVLLHHIDNKRLSNTNTR